MKMMKKRQTLTTKSKAAGLKSILRRWQLYLLALPALAYAFLFNYKPMYGILIAFKKFKIKLGVWDSPWAGPFGLDNFKRLFDSYWFPVILKNTFVINGLNILLTFPLPIILALMVNEVRKARIRKGFQIISYAPHFISTVIVCSMVVMFTAPETGILNLITIALGGTPTNVMYDPDAFKWVYVISGIWQTTGWGSIIYFATLSSVDPALHEAAEIDGANRLQRIWYINIPVLIPTIVIMLIMRFGQVMNVGYEKVYLLQNNINLLGSEVISTYVYKVGLENAEYAFSTAAGLFNSVVNCIFLIVVNKICDKLSGSSLF